ncbi:MAG: hypothetical protein ACRDN9_06580 [Streptosporangiaceae bacterium]
MSEVDPWVRADEVVRGLQSALARWRGGDACRSVRWYWRGVSGEPSEETVAVSLTVSEAEALIRVLAAVPESRR